MDKSLVLCVTSGCSESAEGMTTAESVLTDCV
jgi:hypothetical protein